MDAWWTKQDNRPASSEQTIRAKYASFRNLLSLNNECLEILADVQEDLHYVPASRNVFGDRINVLFDRLNNVVTILERLTGDHFPQLVKLVRMQQEEVEAYIAARGELARPPLVRWLSEVDRHAEPEVGGKAAVLGEIRNRLLLPVPDGFVLTAEAYRQFCGIPLWAQLRDATHNIDLNDLQGLERISSRLAELVRKLPVPRPIEAALMERARAIQASDAGLAVRSSAVGEGGERTFAGQFLTFLNVAPDKVVEAYKQVVASRFSAKALFYRLSAGLPEVDSPMAVLCLRVIRAQASGVMYTRDPKDPERDVLWITATRGLGLDIASGRAPADLFVISRKRPHPVLELNIAHKEEQIGLREGGGLARQALHHALVDSPSLDEMHMQALAEWAIQIENYFGCPQDVEWVLDENGKLWIVQSRALVLADTGTIRWKSRMRGDPILSGGRSVYPGRVSGTAHLVTDRKSLNTTPQGSILFLRKASPEIIEVFPRISGLVAEWGNLTGHAAALLREFTIPSVFQLPGAFEKLRNGDPVSLDAVQPRVYAGTFWPERDFEIPVPERYHSGAEDAINGRMLALHLLDPSAFNFRPAGCKSAHDVLRFCHEKAIESMFALNDSALERGSQRAKRLLTPTPVCLHVLDLGGGLVPAALSANEVRPSDIVSRPFQALWRGMTHPGVTWTRDMPASLGDLASVMSTSFTSPAGPIRALGEKSYLLIADEYMNLNSRLAYHFTLVDACVSDVPGSNYISFRFAGGGAARPRRNLRARFIEACLAHHGFQVDRRGDLVNAWFKKAPAAETEAHLDVLGRLMACSSQLDMYMTSSSVVSSYVQQFMEGNYSFQVHNKPPEKAEVSTR